MLEANDKAQLEKARAGSASALAKLAEMEQEVAGLRSEMESNNQEIQRSLSNLLSLVEKLVSPQESSARVARTGVPTHTITKEDDARPALAKSAGEPSVHELLKKTLQKPQPASVYLR
jgi:L-lactate utilization protein LutB